jgi:hypothetical protein
MVATATFDKDVVAEWERRVKQYRRSTRRTMVVFAPLLLVAALPPILGFVTPFPYSAFAAFVVVVVAILCGFAFRADLTCPHCGDNPVLGNQVVPLWQIDHCAKCSYWLLNPRRGIST